MEFEIYKEVVEVPKCKGYKTPVSPVTLAIIPWLETDDSTLKIKCKSLQEARTAYSVAYSYRKGNKLDYTIYKRGTEVYLIKA